MRSAYVIYLKGLERLFLILPKPHGTVWQAHFLQDTGFRQGAFGKHNTVVFKNYMEVADLRHLFIDINLWQIR